MKITNIIESLDEKCIESVFDELAQWDQTGGLPENSLTRHIILEYLDSNPSLNFFSASLEFQMIFYRTLANKYMKMYKHGEIHGEL